MSKLLMRPETRKSMEMLFTARWNLPRQPGHANLTNKEMKITFNEYSMFHPRLMRLNNLKIYCQTEEDQSEMFDFLFYEIRMTSSIVPGSQTETLGHECSLMISELFDKVVEFLESENSWILEEEVEMSLDDDENNVYRVISLRPPCDPLRETL